MLGFFKALQTDVGKAPEDFPTAKGLTDPQRVKLTKLCHVHHIQYAIKKDYDGTNIRFKGMTFYHYDTALKALEAIIQEKSYVYEPAIKKYILVALICPTDNF